MKITINDVIALKELYPKFEGRFLPIKASYKMAKIFKAVDENYNFYTEKLNEIISEYAQRDENGNVVQTEGGTGIKIQQDKIEECNKRLNELSELEVDIPDMDLSIDDFGDIDFPVEDMLVLSKILK